MRHRKKLIFATLAVLAAYATVCFWPHSNPEAVRALATLRSLVEQRQIVTEPTANPSKETLITVDLIVAKLNITDATTGLFCRSADEKRASFAGAGDATRISDVAEHLRSLGVLAFERQCQLDMIGGKKGWTSVSSPVAVSLAVGLAPVPVVPVQSVGSRVEISTEICAHDLIRMTVDCKISWVGTKKTGHPIHDLHTTIDGHVRTGETLVVGGLTKKWDAPTLFRLPLLSDLPGVGDRLQFRREREIEEELIIFATPRILTAVAAK